MYSKEIRITTAAMAMIRKWKNTLNPSTLTIFQKAHPGEPCNAPSRPDPRHSARQSDYAKRLPALLLIHQRIENHDHHAENRENDLRQDSKVINAWREGRQ